MGGLHGFHGLEGETDAQFACLPLVVKGALSGSGHAMAMGRSVGVLGSGILFGELKLQRGSKSTEQGVHFSRLVLSNSFARQGGTLGSYFAITYCYALWSISRQRPSCSERVDVVSLV